MKIACSAIPPIPCQSRERSELVFMEITAIQEPGGRRRKKCSAICSSLRGYYVSVLVLKGLFLRGANFVCDILLSYRATDLAVSYPQGWDLFFFIFYILSLFYDF